MQSFNRLLLASFTAAALLSGCGGGSSSSNQEPPVGTRLVCNASNFAPGAVVAVPTAAQLAAFAGSYAGDEGSYDESFNFTRTGAAALQYGDTGSVLYNGTAYTPVSTCFENNATTGAMIYLHFGSGHIDLFTAKRWSGVSPADGTTIISGMAGAGTADTTAPMVTAPTAITVQAVSPGDTTVPASQAVIAAFLSGASAADDVDGVLTANITHNAPANFPLGATTVTFSVTDAAGNTGTATSTVTITANTGGADTTPPVVTAPGPVTVQAASGATSVPATHTAIVAFLAGATAVDNVDGVVTGGITHDAPANFPVGATTVTFSVTDVAGNTGTATSIVTVTAASGGSGLTIPSGSVITGGATVSYQLMPAIPGGKIITYEEGTATVKIYDYVDTLGVAVTDTGMSLGIAPYNGCALNPAWVNASAPACSSVGVSFDRAAGQITFSSTLMKPVIFTCPGDCRMSGSLSFTPY